MLRLQAGKKRKPNRDTSVHPTKVRREKSRLLIWPNEVYVITPDDVDMSIIIADPEKPQSTWGHFNNQFKFALEVPHTQLRIQMQLWVDAMALVKHRLYLPKTKGRLTYLRYTEVERHAILYNLTWTHLGYTENQEETALKIYRLAFPDF